MAGLPERFSAAPPGRHDLPADVVARYQRERLLAATIELVAKRGYRGTSVDQIVKRAKVGYVAFYELFEGKEECFLAAFELIVEDTRAVLSAEIPRQAPWSGQISTGLGVLVELISADPARARVAIVEVQAATPQVFARYQEAIDEAMPKLREGRALRPGLPALSDTLEEAVIGGIAWIFHQRLVNGESDRIRGLLSEVVQSALAPYLGELEAREVAEATEMLPPDNLQGLID
jgi:AcrR family transcriptional regulator